MIASAVATPAPRSAVRISSRSFDHRTASTRWGGPASRYQRVERVVRAPRPNYAARRIGVVLAGIVALTAMVPVVDAVLAGFGAEPAFADASLSAEHVPDAEVPVAHSAHVARAGDSLWSIADEHRGDVGRDRYVRALIELNGSTAIVVGQAVILP